MRKSIYQATISTIQEKGEFIVGFKIGKNKKIWKFSKKNSGNGIKMYLAFLDFMGAKESAELINKNIRCFIKTGRVMAVGLIEEDKFFIRDCIDGVIVKEEELY